LRAAQPCSRRSGRPTSERWAGAARAGEAAGALCGRIRRWLQPAWGLRLSPAAYARNDLTVSNILTDGEKITGVVDWDEFGLGSRAPGLIVLALDCQQTRRPCRGRPAAGQGDIGRGRRGPALPGQLPRPGRARRGHPGSPAIAGRDPGNLGRPRQTAGGRKLTQPPNARSARHKDPSARDTQMNQYEPLKGIRPPYTQPPRSAGLRTGHTGPMTRSVTKPVRELTGPSDEMLSAEVAVTRRPAAFC
jgi:hypothetical protein